MRRFVHRGVVFSALAAAMTAGGCYEQQLRECQEQYNDLSVKHEELQGRYAQAAARQQELETASRNRDALLADKDRTIGELRAQLAARPDTAPGETTVIERPVYRETLSSDILFDSGRATLKREGVAELSRVASVLTSRYAGMHVRVFGYTDSDPIRKSKWKDNLELSVNRAMAVTRHLISREVPAESIETIGMGATYFVAGNRTAAEKARNRRVEIVVVRQ